MNDHVDINNSLTADFTLELDIKTSSTSLTGMVAYHGNGLIWSDVIGTANDFTLAVLNNKISFYDGNKVQGNTGNKVVIKIFLFKRLQLYYISFLKKSFYL